MIVVRGRLFRDGIQSVLQSNDRIIISDCETLDEVASRPEIVPAPDLFVVGGGSAQDMVDLFASIKQLRSRMPKARWLILSPRTDPHLLREALEAGADGLLLEDSPAEVLQLLTRLVLLGHSFVPASLVRVLGDYSASESIEQNGSDTPARQPGTNDCPSLGAGHERSLNRSEVPVRPRSGLVPEQLVGGTDGRRQTELSDRENEILGCLVSGHSNKTIARKLDIAEATVKVHVKGLLRKMQVSNRTQAAVRALKFPTSAYMSDNSADEMMK